MNRSDSGFRKGLLIVFLAGMALGIVSINLLMTDAVRENGVFCAFLENGIQREAGFEPFFRLLPKRMGLMLVLLLAAAARPFLPVAAVAGGVLGWLAGVYQGAALLEAGFAGLLASWAALLPQTGFYAAALLMMFRGAWLREKGWIPGGKAFARCLLCGFGIFFLGILTENWLNPAILHAFWKIYR